jgi:pyruvate dehydrogenase E2 component (dihydrolipoamide acetyltransferase)
LQDADKKGLSTIGEEVKQLAKKARENSLKPQDYEVIEVSRSFLFICQ